MDTRTPKPAPGRRRFKIFQEEVKLRHTPHWDADYMSRAEFDAYMRGEFHPDRGAIDARQASAVEAAAADRDGRPSAWLRFVRTWLGFR